MSEAPAPRIAALDLTRGVAVLGILAVNISGFAGPTLAALTPDWQGDATLADRIAFAAVFVLFEGKMRLLFTLLFGASMVLFIERVEAGGRDGTALQLRRLGWLFAFGWLHYALLWHGDILTMYAMLGLVALAFRNAAPLRLAIGALLFYLAWHALGMAGTAFAGFEAEAAAPFVARAQAETATLHAGFLDQVHTRAVTGWASPFAVTIGSIGETVPLMLLGMALYRSGFFAGEWPAALLRRLASSGTGIGLGLTLALLAWCWRRDFPPGPMFAVLLYWAALPHLLMGLGYAAALLLAAPRLLATGLGRRLEAAGRMAFSNYLGTSLVMTALFSGWGLNLAGRFGAAALLGFVALGWGLMLGWSPWWLARFRQGPLEWAWRSLTEWRVLPLRR